MVPDRYAQEAAGSAGLRDANSRASINGTKSSSAKQPDIVALVRPNAGK